MLTADFRTVCEVVDRIKRNHGARAYLFGESAACHRLGIAPDQWIVVTDAPERLSLPTVYGISYVRMPEITEERIVAHTLKKALYIDGLVVDTDRRVVFDPHHAMESVDAGTLRLTAAAADATAWLRDNPTDMLRLPRLTVSLRGKRTGASTLALPNSMRNAINRGGWHFDGVHLNQTEMQSAVRHELSVALTSRNRREILDSLRERRVLEAVLPDIARLASSSLRTATHREEHVLEHVLLAIDALPERASLETVLGVLFHDVGKLVTRLMVWKTRGRKVSSTGSSVDNGSGVKVFEPIFPNHEYTGAARTYQVLRKLGFDTQLVDAVVNAVWVHMDLRKHPTELSPERLWNVLSLSPGHFETALAVHSADVAGRRESNTADDPALDHAHAYAEARRHALPTITTNPISPRMLIEAHVKLDREVLNALYSRLHRDAHAAASVGTSLQARDWLRRNITANGRLSRAFQHHEYPREACTETHGRAQSETHGAISSNRQQIGGAER